MIEPRIASLAKGLSAMGRQDRAEETRRKILDGAAEIFLELGYSRSNINDISAKAAVTKGALYFHFDSKEAVAVAIVEESARRQRESCAGIIGSPAPALEKLIQISFASAALLRMSKFVQCGMAMATEIGEHLGAGLRSLMPSLEFVRELTEQARGDLRPEIDAAVAARVIDAMQFGVAGLAQVESEFEEIEHHLAQAWQVILRGLVREEVVEYFQQFLARSTAQRPAASSA